MKKPPTPPSNKVAKDSAQGRQLSRDRIAADIEAFQKSGGHIQVLGTTRWHNNKKTTLTLAEESGQAEQAE